MEVMLNCNLLKVRGCNRISIYSFYCRLGMGFRKLLISIFKQISSHFPFECISAYYMYSSSHVLSLGDIKSYYCFTKMWTTVCRMSPSFPTHDEFLRLFTQTINKIQ